jgi:hypothetical protein
MFIVPAPCIAPFSHVSRLVLGRRLVHFVVLENPDDRTGGGTPRLISTLTRLLYRPLRPSTMLLWVICSMKTNNNNNNNKLAESYTIRLICPLINKAADDKTRNCSHQPTDFISDERSLWSASLLFIYERLPVGITNCL